MWYFDPALALRIILALFSFLMVQPPVHKATVKNVLSGDTVILRGKPRPNGPPLERLLALSNVQAPRLGNKDRDDEVVAASIDTGKVWHWLMIQPFAFGSREFLRKLLVGKEVSFVPEYTVTTTTPQREYGFIITSNGDQVAELGIKEGWLKVRDGKARGDTEEHEVLLDRLHDLEDEARQAKNGMWNSDTSGIRDVSFTFEGDSRAFLNKYKGQPLDGNDFIINGGRREMRVY